MIAALLLALAADGPALRLGPTRPDGGRVVLSLDRRGAVAARILCPAGSWADPQDAANAIISSTEVLATVIATDGRLTMIDQLGPSRYACVLIPREGRSPDDDASR